jgi:hypothetical protein
MKAWSWNPEDNMPLNIEEMRSDVTVFQGDLPLNQQQIEQLVSIVMQRLEEKERAAERSREAAMIRHQATPAMYLGEGN